MQDDVKKVLDIRKDLGGFIKTTDYPNSGLTPEQKVVLNRKGNTLFNQGEINTAKRLFITTGYSDGLSRVADTYLNDGDELSALKMYWLAHNTRKSSPLIEKLAKIITIVLLEKD